MRIAEVADARVTAATNWNDVWSSACNVRIGWLPTPYPFCKRVLIFLIKSTLTVSRIFSKQVAANGGK